MSKKDLSRAEQVRKRREQEQAKRMERIVKETTRPIPVTTRAKPNTPKSKKKPVQNARRRFQIAVPAAPTASPTPVVARPGARSIRSISIPRPQFGWRSVSFIIAIILGIALYYAFNLPQFRAMDAQVVGNQIVSPVEINSVMNITGQPIFLINTQDLETRLRLNYPELASVRVNVSLPNLVTVKVTERKPIIRWEQDGGYTWIAEDGVAFHPRGEIDGLISVIAESAPPAAGAPSDPLNPSPYISAEMVRMLKGLAGHVPPGQFILYDAHMGFGWNDPRGWRVYFGTEADNVTLKMSVYESMVNSLAQRGIRPALINVTYPTAPYYRMTQ